MTTEPIEDANQQVPDTDVQDAAPVAQDTQDVAPAPEPEAPKAEKKKTTKTSRKKVDLDEKLAGQGTFAVGVQAMMRNRINGRN